MKEIHGEDEGARLTGSSGKEQEKKYRMSFERGFKSGFLVAEIKGM